jgi:hypothetical protein
MLKIIIYISILSIFSGCTQVITAPIYVAGAVVSTTIDVTGSAVGAVIDASSDEDED